MDLYIVWKGFSGFSYDLIDTNIELIAAKIVLEIDAC